MFFCSAQLICLRSRCRKNFLSSIHCNIAGFCGIARVIRISNGKIVSRKSLSSRLSKISGRKFSYAAYHFAFPFFCHLCLFLRLYNHIQFASGLSHGSDYYLFKVRYPGRTPQYWANRLISELENRREFNQCGKMIRTLKEAVGSLMWTKCAGMNYLTDIGLNWWAKICESTWNKSLIFTSATGSYRGTVRWTWESNMWSCGERSKQRGQSFTLDPRCYQWWCQHENRVRKPLLLYSTIELLVQIPLLWPQHQLFHPQANSQGQTGDSRKRATLLWGTWEDVLISHKLDLMSLNF